MSPDLFESFFAAHTLTCPCGATLSTRDLDLAKQWTLAHAPHGAMNTPETQRKKS